MGDQKLKQGITDDLVMSFGMAMYIRDTALKYRQRGIDIQKQTLNNMKVNRTPYQASYGVGNQKVKNPYQMNTPDGNGGYKLVIIVIFITIIIY